MRTEAIRNCLQGSNVRSDYEKGIVILDNTNLKDFEIWFDYLIWEGITAQ